MNPNSHHAPFFNKIYEDNIIKNSTAFIVVSLLAVLNVFAADKKKAATLPKDLKEYQARIEKLIQRDLLGEHESLNGRICCKELLFLLCCCYKPHQDDLEKNEYKQRMVRQELYRRDPLWQHRGDFARIC